MKALTQWKNVSSNKTTVGTKYNYLEFQCGKFHLNISFTSYGEFKLL